MILGAEGRPHADKMDAIADPPSLVDHRRRLEGMLPRVDLRDLIEVMAWHPGFVAAFAGVSGGRNYSFAPTNLAGARRTLRDPDALGED
jgi:hypothetical protein